ncbi:hypothetical protein B0H15DRAFT_958210 [Mycena belliarum]|uniref:Uncharacterized protein n=1 Tax=Mycena belliarum TaxID=1033014 RepID=A0AAD6TNL6_9AGAR|nr:hypothetical protein B0H15DRAFT_958210 [Mycena belliae]
MFNKMIYTVLAQASIQYSSAILTSVLIVAFRSLVLCVLPRPRPTLGFLLLITIILLWAFAFGASAGTLPTTSPPFIRPSFWPVAPVLPVPRPRFPARRDRYRPSLWSGSPRFGRGINRPVGPPSPLCALTTSALFVPVAPLHAPHRQRLQHPPSAAAGPALLSASPLYRRSSTTAHRRSPVLGVLRRGVLLYLHHAVLPSMPRPAAATPFAPPPFAPPPLARSPRRRSPRRRAPRMFGRFGVHTSPLPSPSFRARRRSPRSPLAPGFTALGPLGSLHAGRQAGISSPSF